MKRFLQLFLVMLVMFPFTVKADEIIVGSATDNKNLAPFVNSYPYSWIEIIYQASEIGQPLTIGSIAFEYAGGPTLSASKINIYLAETTKTQFADKSQWTPEEELTLVYSGANVVLGDEAWETFELDTPFNYSGEKNLAVVVSKAANNAELFLTWSCYDDPNSVMFTASDTDVSFTQYPVGDGLATYSKKPVMKLTLSDGQGGTTLPAAPCNLRATVEQNVPDYEHKYKITMEWDAVEGVDDYNVYFSTSTVTDQYMGFTTDCRYTMGYDEEGTVGFYVTSVVGELESEPSEKYEIVIKDESIDETTSSFVFYPNPVDDKLYVETGTEVKEIIIYDVYGKQVGMPTSQRVIDIAGLNRGVYFIKVVTGDGEAVKRFVKK